MNEIFLLAGIALAIILPKLMKLDFTGRSTNKLLLYFFIVLGVTMTPMMIDNSKNLKEKILFVAFAISLAVITYNCVKIARKKLGTDVDNKTISNRNDT